MSVNGVSPSLTSPVGYDRHGSSRPGGAPAAPAARSGEAMRVEVSPEAKVRAATAAATSATADAAASADFFASAAGSDALANLLPSPARARL
jgi:hypothetical protein